MATTITTDAKFYKWLHFINQGQMRMYQQQFFLIKKFINTRPENNKDVLLRRLVQYSIYHSNDIPFIKKPVIYTDFDAWCWANMRNNMDDFDISKEPETVNVQIDVNVDPKYNPKLR
jgi:hypothetical protein